MTTYLNDFENSKLTQILLFYINIWSEKNALEIKLSHPMSQCHPLSQRLSVKCFNSFIYFIFYLTYNFNQLMSTE